MSTRHHRSGPVRARQTTCGTLTVQTTDGNGGDGDGGVTDGDGILAILAVLALAILLL